MGRPTRRRVTRSRKEARGPAGPLALQDRRRAVAAEAEALGQAESSRSAPDAGRTSPRSCQADLADLEDALRGRRLAEAQEAAARIDRHLARGQRLALV